MSKTRVVKTVEDLEFLAQQLAKCADVTRFDAEQEKEARALAYCFRVLESEFRTFLEEQLPRLTAENLTAEEVCDLLYEIGVGFHEILHHIRQPKFYRHLEQEKGQ